MNGHVGLGVKCAKEVATAIRGGIIQAKMSCVPVRRGYWGNKIGKVHTVPVKSTGKCGSVTIRLIPAPRGAGIVAARTPKKVLQMAGIDDCYTCSRGSRKTLGNFVRATFYALASTYGFLSPDLWTETKYTKSPLQEFTGEEGLPLGEGGAVAAGAAAAQLPRRSESPAFPNTAHDTDNHPPSTHPTPRLPGQAPPRRRPQGRRLRRLLSASATQPPAPRAGRVRARGWCLRFEACGGRMRMRRRTVFADEDERAAAALVRGASPYRAVPRALRRLKCRA
jgi:ribosomal protein S5